MLWKRNGGSRHRPKVHFVNPAMTLLTQPFPLPSLQQPQKHPDNTDSAASPRIA